MSTSLSSYEFYDYYEMPLCCKRYRLRCARRLKVPRVRWGAFKSETDMMLAKVGAVLDVVTTDVEMTDVSAVSETIDSVEMTDVSAMSDIDNVEMTDVSAMLDIDDVEMAPVDILSKIDDVANALNALTI